MSRRITTFDDFRDAITEYRLPRVLIAAIELDLFTAIGNVAWAIPNLAREMKVSERGLAILCRNLAMAGLLKKRGETYRNSRLAATALNVHHPAYRGEYLRLMTRHWADWGRLPESVKTGLPLDHDEPDEPDYRRRFTWAMHHRTLETAPKIAAQIDLRGARTLLDLGGGPGTY
ncbi:MAG TPA: methyltransferase dimerization domain-containing protein, partial [Nitrospiraceae bacterium]